ncbi:maltokinase N-terminal cap-like domain-containing protein [Streptomyces tremellae]|uniref:Maltokinase N-terminal cap domain-containing protein n=1 Tax=Streptomyces tremellae TaxID=1124239 RepID=A0ABP7FPU3_9ACTN
MAVIHRTTMTPSKEELLAAWLPSRPWFRGGTPDLVRAGGYRLDDPAGTVGIEFMLVTDVSGPEPTTYQVPLTYRGTPLEGARDALVGTSEHGVLGLRQVYDGVYDPVLVERLYALARGAAEPQAQRESNTPDPTVTADPAGAALPEAAFGPPPLAATEGPGYSEVRVAGGGAVLRVHRVLRSTGGDASDAGAVLGRITAGWNLPGGAAVRGTLATVLRP